MPRASARKPAPLKPPWVKITPAMIRAGEEALATHRADMPAEQLVVAIYEAMAVRASMHYRLATQAGARKFGVRLAGPAKS